MKFRPIHYYDLAMKNVSEIQKICKTKSQKSDKHCLVTHSLETRPKWQVFMVIWKLAPIREYRKRLIYSNLIFNKNLWLRNYWFHILCASLRINLPMLLVKNLFWIYLYRIELPWRTWEWALSNISFNGSRFEIHQRSINS